MTIVGAVLLVGVYAPSGLRVNLVGLALGIFNAISFAFLNLWAKALAGEPVAVDDPRLRLRRRHALLAPDRAALVALFAPQPASVWLGLGIVTVFGTLLPYASTSRRSPGSAPPT